MRTIVFLLLCCCAWSCSQPKQPFRPAVFHWQDSLVDCELTRDQLAIIFPARPEAEHWMVECTVEYDTHYICYQPPYAVTVNRNNRLEIPLAVPDSIDPSRLQISHLRFGPADGIYMYKTKSGYFIDALQVFKECDSKNRSFRLYPYLQKKSWYVVHDSLLSGKDSIWYQTQFALFMHDSLDSNF